jgi:hypothetical protein
VTLGKCLVDYRCISHQAVCSGTATVDETNKLRAALGLKPLGVKAAAANATAAVETAEEKKQRAEAAALAAKQAKEAEIAGAQNGLLEC